MSMKFLIFICLIGYNNGILNDPRCAPEESVTEDVKASVDNLCREAKIENDAANNADFVFTYNQGTGPGYVYGNGGLVTIASARNFPAVIGNNIAMSVVYLKPCGLNLPHYHPRASTISYVAQGTIRCGFWSENDGKFHSFVLNQGQGIAFGPGAIHFEQNVGCTNATLVAGFNNEDPGTATVTEGITALPADIWAAATGKTQNEINTAEQVFAQTPAYGVDSCYKACKINKG